MRIVSYNVNGIRAALRKGFAEWLATDPADVVCLQEIKAAREDIDASAIEALGYHCYWYPAEKKGYSGVAILARIKPDAVHYGSGTLRSDAEGRVLRADFGALSVISAYFPSGTSGSERQDYKYQWLDEFTGYLGTLSCPRLAICGDYNIAHREIDLHNPGGNRKNSGFLPEERAWMDRFYEAGYHDSFRRVNGDRGDAYTWWSQRFPTVRAQNKGWRIDYISVSDGLAPYLREAAIHADVVHSDHCPVYVRLDEEAVAEANVVM